MIYPTIHADVRVFLKNNPTWVEGYWDGTSWWEELENSPDTRLIPEDTIDHWEWFE